MWLILAGTDGDKVLDRVEEALDWISFRSEPGIPDALHKDFFMLVDAVLDPVEEMCRMVAEARKYFTSFSEKQRRLVKDIIHTMRQAAPDKELIPAPVEDGTGCEGCSVCPYMKLNTIEKMYLALRDLAPQIELDADTMTRARRPLERMLELS